MAQAPSTRDPSTVRTFAIAGHRGAGKTSLADVLLHAAGVTRVAGRVDEHSSLLDHGALERRRRMTLGLSFAWLEWRGSLLELVDTPGTDALEHEVNLAMATVDAVVAVMSAADGLQLGTERVLQARLRAHAPCLLAVTNADRMGDPARVIDSLEPLVARYGVRIVPLQVPQFSPDGRLKALVGLFGPVPDELAEAVAAARERLVEAVAMTDDLLLERYLEDFALDDALVIEGLAKAVRFGRLVPVLYHAAPNEIGTEAILDAVSRLFPSPVERPVVCALDAQGDEAPIEADPSGPFVAQHIATRIDDQGGLYRVFRVWSGTAPTRTSWVHGETGSRRPVRKLFQVRGPRAAVARYEGPGAIIATWDDLPSRPGDTWTDGPAYVLGAPPPPAPMHAWSLRPVGASRSEERLQLALDALAAIDTGLRREVCELTGGVLLEGLGTDQLDRALALLRGPPFRLEVEAEPPWVAYREAPIDAAVAEGVHRRTVDGDVVEFATITLSISPANDTLEIEVEASDARLPSRFWAPAIDGIRRGLRRGPMASYPVDGLRIVIVDGDYDVFASTDEQFRVAGERAIRAALEQATTRLLEPWWHIEVRSPGAELGTVLTELRARRARVIGLEMDESHPGESSPPARIFAECPYRELRSFAPRLLSLTGGRGRFSGRPSGHEPVPASLVKEAMGASPYRAAGAA